MRRMSSLALVLALALSMGGSAQAAFSWADLTEVDGTTVYGSLAVGSETVDVTITNSAGYGFVQTGGGTDYWTGAAYTVGGVDERPPASDIVALSGGGDITVTFSQAVTNPVLALVSWNGNVAEFGTEISFLSSGQGYFGNGTYTLNGAGTGFTGSGELHGLLELPGTFTSFTFSNTPEYWHGFTVGVQGLPAGDVPAVPVPAAVWLLGSGVVSFAGLRRRIR